MPTYQYKCPSCGNLFEEFQNMSAAPLDRCPQCGEKPERLISGGAGLIFKGSGFYITDYRSSAYKAAASSDSGSSSSTPPPTAPSTPSANTSSTPTNSSASTPAASKPVEKSSKKSDT